MNKCKKKILPKIEIKIPVRPGEEANRYPIHVFDVEIL